MNAAIEPIKAAIVQLGHDHAQVEDAFYEVETLFDITGRVMAAAGCHVRNLTDDFYTNLTGEPYYGSNPDLAVEFDDVGVLAIVSGCPTETTLLPPGSLESFRQQSWQVWADNDPNVVYAASEEEAWRRHWAQGGAPIRLSDGQWAAWLGRDC